MKRITGIYRILNTVTGRAYIGSASHYLMRVLQHKKCFRDGDHHAIALRRAIAKHGAEVMAFKLIEVCAQNDLLRREQVWMDTYRRNGVTLYNSAPTAGSQLGFRHSEESRRKIGDVQRGRKMSPEHGAKISAALKGRPKSKEHAIKVGLAQRGKKLSGAHRALLADRLRADAEKRRGIPLSAEWAAAIKEGHRRLRETGWKMPEHVAVARAKKVRVLDELDVQVAVEMWATGWTQRTMAAMFGVGPSTISRIVRGKRKYYGVPDVSAGQQSAI